ncbi:alpha-1,4-digalacturonate transport system substrate-binding protein [Friedmanniella endophytica]|uniref:Alpha-1,4-digalacturonate transport system substrate-binding protein n=1 Tax=Microlunatus kandeliicorticis TaxID=1759536 RepID=A0A7W3ITP2_9ACTN|nr:extracellular solute-binding protein [Microlunatus kandeliicorticis]MBA8795071.1 alpha-1,4-digalacturonate transport system substrate-binding protein [Microlunatus kandeliicorticis]
MDRRGFLFAGGGLAAAAAGLTACSSGSGSGSGGGSDRPLQFLQSGDANQGGGYAAMAAKYQQQTGVKVEVVEVPNDDLDTKLRNAAQANDLPALARAGSIDPTWKDATVDLAPISDAYQIDKTLSAVDEDGKVLSLPSDLTAVGLFLNKSLFAKAKVDYPATADQTWTWDECVAAIKKVQQRTSTRYGMVMDRSSHRLKAMLFEFGSDYFNAGANGTFTTNNRTGAALDYFKSLNDDRFMPRSVWLSDADGNALFKSGDVVAYYSGCWQIADFAENIKDFDWVSTTVPKQPVRTTNYGNAASMVVFDGDQSDAALKFLDWMYKPENYTTLAETSGFLPVVPNLDVRYRSNQDAFALYNAEIAASAPIVAEQNKLSFGYQIKGLAPDGDPVRDETVKFLNDEQGLDKTISNICTQFTQSLS